MSGLDLTAADELAHPPGDERLWGESWYFDFTNREGTLGGYVRLGLYPNLGVAWYWACLVGEGRPLVTVIDHEVALPKAPSMEIRADGLWADHTVETPFEHMSLGCEAFAVAVDDPAEVYGDLRGERVPFGFDLEWETVGGAYPYPGVDRYEVPCRVTGEVLVGQERIELDGPGQRDHSWGVRDWFAVGWMWSAFHLDDGTQIHAVGIPTMPGYGVGYVQAGDTIDDITSLQMSEDVTANGLVTAAGMTISPGDLDLRVEPVAFGALRMDSPDGRVTLFPRAMARVRTGDGRFGTGWIEWNHPQPVGT